MTHRDDTKENESKYGKDEKSTEISGDELSKHARVQLFRVRLLNLQNIWSESQLQSASLKPRSENPEACEKYRLKRIAPRRMIEEHTREALARPWIHTANRWVDAWPFSMLHDHAMLDDRYSHRF